MNTIPQSERLAVLLSLMGEGAKDAALEGVPAETSQQVEATMAEFKKHPPTQDEVEYVIDDFVKYFRFAMNTVDQELQRQEAADSGNDPGNPNGLSDAGSGAGAAGIGGNGNAPSLQIAEEGFEVEIEPVKKFLPPQLSGDHARDLNLLHPYQVACAIQNESAVTISLVIRSLATEHAAKTLELLPDALRPAVFLQLAKPSAVSKTVRDMVLETTIHAALRVEERQPVADAAGEMVSLIRSVPKPMRAPMLEELQKTDEELAAQVKSQMYQFEDLLLLGDRDLQQILGQTDSDSLVLALQGADEGLVESIMKNMSKRARESLQEEMGFKTNVKQEEIDVGRAQVVSVLIELDESGAITLE